MKPTLPTNRSFGWTFTVIFVAIGVHGLGTGGVQAWMLALAMLVALVTLARDELLTPLNRAWMKLGELMGRVVSPVVLGVIFFGVFAPVGLLMRAFGRDAMCRRFLPSAPTYWIKRDPPGPADDSFGNMF